MVDRLRHRVAAAILASALLALPADSFGGLGDCSQPISTGLLPAATDCLFILQVAVFVQTCDPNPCICAPKGSMPTAATDALLCLQAATGQQASLDCPCTVYCEEAMAPTCGGECGPGEICAPDPFDPEYCECQNDCEASQAPTCGGSCDTEPGATCQPYGFSVEGGAIEDYCTCLEPGTVFCADAQTPECGGICPPGRTCEQQGGSCVCNALPLQPACAAASAPACGGICPEGSICEDTGGSCGCVPYVGQFETCFDAQGPVCGGACLGSEICSTDFDEEDCECFEPCELADAPACGGACSDPLDSCVVHTLHLGGSSLDFCECE